MARNERERADDLSAHIDSVRAAGPSAAVAR